jgi:hypothetical protein
MGGVLQTLWLEVTKVLNLGPVLVDILYKAYGC